MTDKQKTALRTLSKAPMSLEDFQKVYDPRALTLRTSAGVLSALRRNGLVVVESGLWKLTKDGKAAVAT